MTKPRRAHPAYNDVKEMKQKLRSQLPLTFSRVGGGLSPPGCLIKDTNRSKQLHHNLICHLASQTAPCMWSTRGCEPIHQPMWSETAKRRQEGGTDQMVTKGTNEMRGPTHTHTHTYASVDTFNKCMPAFIVSVIMYTHLTGQIAPRWSQAVRHLMELRGPFQVCN